MTRSPEEEALLKAADEYGSSVFTMSVMKSYKVLSRLMKAATAYARSRHPEELWGTGAIEPPTEVSSDHDP